MRALTFRGIDVEHRHVKSQNGEGLVTPETRASWNAIRITSLTIVSALVDGEVQASKSIRLAMRLRET